MLIKDIGLLEKGHLKRGCDILIENDRIVKVGPDIRVGDDETIDGHGMLAIPGLINAHTHLAMTLFRGYADDTSLVTWLKEKIWPLEAKLTPEDVYWGAKLGCLELIRFGTTCFNDMYYFMDEAARATKEMGLRSFQSVVLFDMRPDLSLEAKTFISNWQNDELIRPAVGPHAVYTCSEETLLRGLDLAERYDTTLHIHLSETKREVDDFVKEHGKSPVEYLDSIGFLSDRVLAAHCTWLSEKDISILAEKKVNVVHCPISNLKLATGIAPLCDLMAAGVNICLGTDSASSNNNLNLFEEMKTSALLERIACRNRDVIPAEKVWKMATNNAYKAFDLNLGIHEGAMADICLIDLKKPWFVPGSNIISNLIYSMPGIVDTTIVNGMVLMKGGIIPGEEEILAKAESQFEDLLER